MCYYQGIDYPEGSYVCMGADKYVCFEGRWLLALENAPECVEEAGWKRLATRYVTLIPSEEEVRGWKRLTEYTITLTPTGVPPPPEECTTPGETKCVGYDLYTCSSGYKWELTKKNAEECGYVPSKFPWQWLAIGGAAIAGVILLIPKKIKKK